MTTLTIGRILGILMGGYFLCKTFVLIRKKRETLFEFFLWSGLGLALIIFSAFPGLTNLLSRFLGTTKTTNAIFLLAILTLLFLNFFIFKLVRNLHYDVSKLNEELSVLKSQQDKQNKKVSRSARSKKQD
ncbi:MAG TPA: DUF2304 domain-containing protein [Patescibacteria group bacterium]|nr:DUF2304 domain-containing protein [Patescibacteria group bacterium]